MTTPNNKLETIRALLAKAERTDNEAERDAYNAKAAELIAKYGVDAALVSAKRGTREMPTHRTWQIRAPYMTDRKLLLAAIGHSLGCPNVGIRRYDRETGKYRFDMTLYGFESDLERVDVLYTSLLVQMAQGIVGTQVPWYEDARTFRKSWMFGFTAIVARRLEAAERRAAQDSSNEPGTALVLADRRTQVQQFFDSEHSNLRTTNRRVPNSEEGRRAGYAAGRRANLGQPGVTVSSGRRQLDSEGNEA